MTLLSSALDIFFGTTGSSQIAGVRVDAMMSEELGLSSQVSQYPREDSSPFTDGIIPNLETIQVEGIITTAGVMFLDGLLSTGSFQPVGESKLVAARQALIKVHKARAPVSLVTSGITYNNYGMTSCTITRRGGGADGELTISASFIAMPTVKLQTTVVSVANASPAAARVAAKAGQTKTSVGQASGAVTTTAASTPSPSAAYSLLNTLGGL